MSDTEDDISSMSGSEMDDGEDDFEVEMEEGDEVGETHSDMEENDLDETVEVDRKSMRFFKKEIWQLKKTPYSAEIDAQANRHLIKIKRGLAHSILLNDAAVGYVHWVLELEKYIDFYGRRFSKEEHLEFIKLLLPLVTKGNIYRNVKITIRVLNTLLCRKDFLMREDLTIEWKPLYDLYAEVSSKHLEEDGLFLMPEGFRTDLHTLIFYARHYFSDNAVQEILDECRPYMCVWDESSIRAWKRMDLFMCMNMSAEKQATHGAGLWFEEAWHWYSTIDCNPLFEESIMKMFHRLAVESPGLIDWTDKLDLIFTRLLRSLRLGKINGLMQTFNADVGAVLIVYMFGTAAHDAVMKHLVHLFNQIESYLHPSNNGAHTQYLLNLINKLAHVCLHRLKRERTEKTNKDRTIPPIPEKMRLKQHHLDTLVKIMLPCLKLAVFTKTRNEFVSPTFRSCCLMAPKLVLPIVLDMVYPALETLIEPHRLMQTLSTLLGVLIPLVKDQPDEHGKTYRTHAITILNSLLPGLDNNDISKCMVTYQVVGVLVNMIPLVDCSEAVHLRCDLTEDEKELCSATANFEPIISMIMDRMIEMLVDCGQTASTTTSHGAIASKASNTIEDSILHRGTLSVFKGICRNSSTELFEVAAKKLHSMACEHVFDSKIASDSVADMIHVACKYHPEKAFNRFFKLIFSRLQNLITPEFYTEEKVDFNIIWWLTMASRVVKTEAKYLLANWSQVKTLMDMVMPLKKCSIATEKSLAIYDNLLENLTSIQLISGVARRAQFDKPLDEFLPIRHWSAPIDKKTWQPLWYIPNQEAIDRATELLRDYFVPNVDILNNPHGMNKKEMLHRLWLIRYTLIGAAFSLPYMEGPYLPLNESKVVDQNLEETMICKPKGTPEVSLDGRNVRQVAFECVIGLLEYLLEHQTDDVKSINEAITIARGIPTFRGYSKDSYNSSFANYRVTKTILCDKLSGNKSNIEMIVEEYVLLLHRKRVANVQGWHFKQQHLDIYRILLRVATSVYSENRQKAQQILMHRMLEHPYSYKYILDDILKYLDPNDKNVTDEQLKGALYLLIDGKRQALCLRMDFESQCKIWPALVSVRHTEKPSIIGLLEMAQNLIVDKYESYRMKYAWFDDNVEAARKLLTCTDANSPLHDSNLLSMPSQEQLDANQNNLVKHYEKMRGFYLLLIERLLTLANDANLHWRPIDMAHSMLSMQVRRDEALHDGIVKLFTKLLVHDTIKTRRIATAVVASWLKMNKPKAVKREYVIPYKEENTGPGAKFPIKYGLRDDNRVMIYEEEKLPKTDEEWDEFQFCGKQHWGIYTWPKKLITYAPLKDQKAIDRDYEDFSDTEKFIVQTFQDPEFINKIRVLFAVEEKKGEDTFNAVNFSLFQGLIRAFGDVLCPVLKDQLEILIVSSKEADHKLAAEIAAGLINGSKMWRYARQRRMWAWLGPILSKTFETIKEEGLRNWGVAVATICGCSEARLLKPLIDILLKLLERPTENAFTASSRLFLVQSAFCQFEWRGVQLWNKMMDMLKLSLVHQFQNLRTRVAVSLVSATWYDFPAVYVSPNLPQNLRPPLIDTVSTQYQELISSCWDEVRVSKDECSAPSSNSNGSVPNMNNGDVLKDNNLTAIMAEETMSHSSSTNSLSELSEVKKASRLALKALIVFVYNMCNQAYIALPPSFISMIPLFCHYSNDVGDEELQRTVSNWNSGYMYAIYVSPENAQPVLTAISQILTSQCWWKAKVAALRMLRMLVFSNSYVFIHHRDDIGHLLIAALNDCQIEVRERAAEALSTLMQAKFFETTPQIVDKFSLAAHSTDPIEAHGGVLGLSAIVRANPYTVPAYLPDVLMRICRFSSNKQAIVRDSVKRALSEFKRTHQDSWREHESQFNEDQLTVLRDLLVSANYYV